MPSRKQRLARGADIHAVRRLGVEHEAVARLAAKLVGVAAGVEEQIVRLRCATCAIARPDAELISPMIATTLSRSIKRSALVDAVCGLTLSSAIKLDLAAHDAAGGVDLLDRER